MQATQLPVVAWLQKLPAVVAARSAAVAVSVLSIHLSSALVLSVVVNAPVEFQPTRTLPVVVEHIP